MKNYVILHGHFYQPPREDPWRGIIEYQESADPFGDWNRRITAECYAACAQSRVLDESGKIIAIRNNYETLSWNFGPTLLSWMEVNAPNVYRKIQEADRLSRDRLGYGNGVAQSFNHTILPLDRPEDVRIQVRWGLEDFRRRFEREADGMWLPECAVNDMVLDSLIEHGLKYVILSPWQADALLTEDGDWNELGDRPGPTDRPFKIERPGGDIAAFFYDPELASGISFGHLLRSREGFEHALLSGLDRSGGKLISIATDGEIYGHHEPFGDMCLAALTESLGDDSDLVFTNYAAYLADNPPLEVVRLRNGDDGRGSSWSCAHGVGRWMRDCGCSTGGEEGWNQEWRTPLRKSYDRVRAIAGPIWIQVVEELSGRDAMDVLADYGAVLAGRVTAEGFSGNILEKGPAANSGQNRNRLLEALEGAKYLQFMYTSCGWFFSELSGLEPVQNIRYAYRAIELLDRRNKAGVLAEFERFLKKAPSNIKGNGADLLKRLVIPKEHPDATAAASFFWRNLYNLPAADDIDGDLEPGEISRRTVGADDGSLDLEGSIEYSRRSTLKKHKVRYRTIVNSRLFCPSVTLKIDEEWVEVPISVIPRKLRMEIQETLLRRSERKLRRFIGKQALVRIRDVKIVRALDLPLSESGRQSVEMSLHYGPILAIERLRDRPATEWPAVLPILDEILSYRVEYGINGDDADIESCAGALVSDYCEQLLDDGRNRDLLEQLVAFLEVIHRNGLRPLKPFAQNAVYSLLAHRYHKGEAPDHRKDGDDAAGSAEGLRTEDLLQLADMMNINPVRFLDGK